MISFDVKNVALPALDFSEVGKWLGEVAAAHDRRVGNVNYLFCDDEEILRVNREFLHHDYYTDIITFDYSRRDKIGGDIFLSLETVKSNSEEIGDSYEKELLRVIAHGVLHLCGIDDKGPGEREIMENHENEALALWQEMKSRK
ncbi:MAG: rRNA maturation RNase YbeY [Muribaculaceae bacterium]|nr:rRNA maturation RNase YbeY [Muribaculaceae bacterium]MDE6754661.1 rRNA maturation RNase YbeY [Muribaculaceae bacterium]